MIRIKFYAFAFLLLLFPEIGTMAQEAIWLHRLTKEDGLSANNIISMYVDSFGLTWIATKEGLFRFDGRNLNRFPPDATDPKALKESYITGDFFEDSEHNIWFCTHSAIHCYLRTSGHFKSSSLYQGRFPILDGYHAICLEQDSLLWLQAGDKEIFWYNTKNGEQSESLGRPKFDIKLCPAFSKEGHLKYIFSVDGGKSPGLEVFEVDEANTLMKRPIFFDGSNSNHPTLYISSVHYEHDTEIWLAAKSALYKWDYIGEKLSSYPTGDNNLIEFTRKDSVHFLIADIGTGISLFNKESKVFTPFNVQSLINAQTNINPFLEVPYCDRFGNIWITMDEMGLAYGNLNKTKFEFTPKAVKFNGDNNYEYRAIAQRADGAIWCSTFGDGIFLLDTQGKLLRHFHPNNPADSSLPSSQANHILLDQEENLWVGTPSEIKLFIPAIDSFVSIPDSNNRPIPYAVYFHETKTNDGILISTLQQGIYFAHKVEGQWELENCFEAQSDADYYFTIYEDNEGRIYISNNFTSIKIFSFFEGRLKLINSLPITGTINGFHEEEHRLWVATSNGLVELNQNALNDTPKTYTEIDGLSNSNIQSMIADGLGYIWLGTTNGLERFQINDATFTQFHHADGINSIVFDELASFQDQTGTLWFFGNNGATIVNPDGIKFSSRPPQLLLNKIEINSIVPDDLSDENTGATNVNLIDSFSRPYGDNDLLFEFTGIDYSDPEMVQLGYQLEGVNQDTVWLEKGERGIARFPTLKHGAHSLYLFAKNADGLGFTFKKLGFNIAPHWTSTWWFRLLVLILLIAIIYGVYRFRIAQIRKAEAARRQEAEFRQKEAELKQQMAETETAILRLQMNPHFIFNSMNSINSYILKKDIGTASEYLTRFSKLMRMILDLAANQFVSVYEEMEFLKLYIETESMRFENQFDYEIKVDEAIDPDEIILPTMILQPFVENAIWHGIAGHNQGEIKVQFELRGGNLCCAVEDNGRGRIAAKQETEKNHESKALSITAHRLSLLEKESGQKAAYKIIDLKSSSGLPKGTRIELTLPLL